MSKTITVDRKLWKKMVKAMGTGNDEKVMKVYTKLRKDYDEKGRPLNTVTIIDRS